MSQKKKAQTAEMDNQETPPAETGQKEVPPPGGNAAFPVASWDIFYVTKEGFEAHLKLQGDSGVEVLEKAKAATRKILEDGGQPRPVRGFSRDGQGNAEPEIDKETMTYLDAEGVRRCARTTKDGGRCDAKVGELREGKYGDFYPCPNYKKHKGK